jgi:tRNA (cmo5U34)-methyltransferase
VAKKSRPGTVAHPDDPTAWSPIGYTEFVAGMEHYQELQEQVLAATLHRRVTEVLELGTGTGEASARILAAHPEAFLVAMDASRAMLEAAEQRLPPDRVRFVASDIRDRLPEGPFDLVVSVLTVHHLDSNEKQKLYSNIADRLAPGGDFVLGDIVLASRDSPGEDREVSVLGHQVRRLRETPWRAGEIGLRLRRWIRRRSESSTSREAGTTAHVDKPERIDDQLAGMAAAGLTSQTVWQADGYAVLVGTKPMR